MSHAQYWILSCCGRDVKVLVFRMVLFKYGPRSYWIFTLISQPKSITMLPKHGSREGCDKACLHILEGQRNFAVQIDIWAERIDKWELTRLNG